MDQLDDHEGIRRAVFVVQPSTRCRLESESLVVRGIAKDHHARRSVPPTLVESCLHQLRPNTPSLAVRPHRQRTKPDPEWNRGATPSDVEDDGRERNVANDPGVDLGDEAELEPSALPEPVDQACLDRPSERRLVHAPNAGLIRRSLGTNHVRILADDRPSCELD